MFHRTRFVLVESSHPGNIGAAARALKTMGCTRLILVKPRTPRAHQHPDALAMASGAGDVLARAEMAASLDEALADVQWSVALSARARRYGAPLLRRVKPRRVRVPWRLRLKWPLSSGMSAADYPMRILSAAGRASTFRRARPTTL